MARVALSLGVGPPSTVTGSGASKDAQSPLCRGSGRPPGFPGGQDRRTAAAHAPQSPPAHFPPREGVHSVVPSRGQRGASGTGQGSERGTQGCGPTLHGEDPGPSSMRSQRPARRWCGRRPGPLTLVSTQSTWNTAECPRRRTAVGRLCFGGRGARQVLSILENHLPPPHRAAALVG